MCAFLYHFRPAAGPATVVTLFEFLRLPMVSVVGVLMYNEGLEWQVFVGALVVLWANWLNIRAETKAQTKKKIQAA